jgi:hypothetical protein
MLLACTRATAGPALSGGRRAAHSATHWHWHCTAVAADSRSQPGSESGWVTIRVKPHDLHALKSCFAAVMDLIDVGIKKYIPDAGQVVKSILLIPFPHFTEKGLCRL